MRPAVCKYTIHYLKILKYLQTEGWPSDRAHKCSPAHLQIPGQSPVTLEPAASLLWVPIHDFLNEVIYRYAQIRDSTYHFMSASQFPHRFVNGCIMLVVLLYHL